ncbi:hypothetical protein D3C81_1402910 [compost metagenome]
MLLVVGLFGHTVVNAQQLVALEVDLGHLQLRLAFAQLRPGLVQAGADRSVVDGGQQVAFAHQLAFLDQDPGEDAVDLRSDHHAVQRQHRADAGDVAGHVFFHHVDHAHRNGGRCGDFNRGRFHQVPRAQRHQHDQKGC